MIIIIKSYKPTGNNVNMLLLKVLCYCVKNEKRNLKANCLLQYRFNDTLQHHSLHHKQEQERCKEYLGQGL